MATSKEKILALRVELEQKQASIEGLEQEKRTLTTTVEELTSERDELQNYRTTTEPDFTTTKTKLSEAEEQIKIMELSRFASAYKTQEVEYRGEQRRWLFYVLGATILLTGSILFSIFKSTHIIGKWYQEPEFYLLDAMFLTLFVYALKKHSHLGNLIVDYANRKTLAQSYQHLVESDEEASEFETKFQERVAEIITAQPAVLDGKVTIYEHLFDQFSAKIDGVVSTIKGSPKL